MTPERDRPEPGTMPKRRSSAIAFVITAIVLVIVMAGSLVWLDSGTGAATVRDAASAPVGKLQKAGQAPTAPGVSAAESGGPATDPAGSQSPAGTGEILAWQTLSRIDAKIANSITLVTLFVGIIAVLLGLYEYFKLREVERIRADIRTDLRSLFSDEFADLNAAFEQQLSAKLLSRLDTKISTANNSGQHLAAVNRNILLFYVINDLAPSPDTPLTVRHVHACLEIQRALGQITALSEEEKLTGLTVIDSKSANIGRITSLALLEYLANVRQMNLIRGFVNQDLCNRIIERLEVKTGLSSEELLVGRTG